MMRPRRHASAAVASRRRLLTSPVPPSRARGLVQASSPTGPIRAAGRRQGLSYGPPWAHYLGGYQDRLLGGPLGLPGLRYTAPEGVEHKD
jgi:hypothetical protein